MKLQRSIPVLCLLAMATAAQAQTVPTRTMPTELRDGRRALSFGAFVDGGGMIGLTFMLTPRTAFTLDVQGDGLVRATEITEGGVITGEVDQLDVEVLLAPGFRRYMAARGDVASYLAGRVLLGLSGSIDESTTGGARYESWAPSAGGALGFGLEWFVTDAMSLRGEAAVEAVYTHATSSGAGGAEATSNTLTAGIGQSGLAISIWF